MNPQSEPHCLVRNLLACTAALLVLSGSLALAQDTGTLDKGQHGPYKSQAVKQPKLYPPYVDHHFLQRVLFGDMHHHTSLSVDSGLIGNNNGPDVPFIFAMAAVLWIWHPNRVRG